MILKWIRDTDQKVRLTTKGLFETQSQNKGEGETDYSRRKDQSDAEGERDYIEGARKEKGVKLSHRGELVRAMKIKRVSYRIRNVKKVSTFVSN